MSYGKFFVIDGTDGSGKATQTQLLSERMRNEGFSVANISFPRYKTPTGKTVKAYLQGDFGDPTKVSPYIASQYYAEDRKAAASEIRKHIMQGTHVIADRYVAANMGHQGAKIVNDEDRKRFFLWLEDLEYKENDIPRPDLNIILLVPPEISMQLITDRGEKKDGHENLSHLEVALATYIKISEMFPGFTTISCVSQNTMLTREEIHEKIWAIVRPILQ